MKKVLLIEDDSFIVDIYTTKLKEAGYSPIVALDGEEGLNKIKEEKPDLALLDIVIPIIDGWEFLIRAKKIKSDLKIIVLSNQSREEDLEKAKKLGAAKYLVKAHHSPSEVVEEVKKLLK